MTFKNMLISKNYDYFRVIEKEMDRLNPQEGDD